MFTDFSIPFGVKMSEAIMFGSSKVQKKKKKRKMGVFHLLR